jgi:ribosomal protein S6
MNSRGSKNPESTNQNKGRNRKYETVVVLSTDSLKGAQSVEAATGSIKSILERFGASDIRVSDWGRKELAFEVKGSKAGHYIAFEYCSDSGSTSNDIGAQLCLREDILLFQTHRLRSNTASMVVPSDSRFSQRADFARNDLGNDFGGGYLGR